MSERPPARLTRMSHKFEKRCKARQSETRAGSVLAYVTKRITAITPPRALVVLRFLLNNPKIRSVFGRKSQPVLIPTLIPVQQKTVRYSG